MLATDDRSVAEYRLVARDGRVVWVLDNITLEADEHGSIQHGLLFDITERKLAELMLGEQAHVLELIARGLPGLDETMLPSRSPWSGSPARSPARSRSSGTDRDFLVGSFSARRRATFRRASGCRSEGSVGGEVLGELEVDVVPWVALLEPAHRRPRAEPRLGTAPRGARRRPDPAPRARGAVVLAARRHARVHGQRHPGRRRRRLDRRAGTRSSATCGTIPCTLIERGDDEALIEFRDGPASWTATRSCSRYVGSTRHPELSSVDELVFKDGRIFERVLPAPAARRATRRPGVELPRRDRAAAPSRKSSAPGAADSLTSLPTGRRSPRASSGTREARRGPGDRGRAVLLWTSTTSRPSTTPSGTCRRPCSSRRGTSEPVRDEDMAAG